MLWLVVLISGFACKSSAAPVPSLEIQQTGTELELTFEGRLQRAAQAAGPFTNVTGAFSPQRLPRPAAATFWRAFNPGLAHYSQRVAVASEHSLTIASDGTLWAWGYNGFGQLGIGVAVSQTNLPQRVGSNVLWKTVATGCAHTLALRDDGTLWAWGSGGDGKLGNGSFSMANSPQSIMSNATWKAIGASCSHSAAVRADGTLWTWGGNWNGQLGDGTYTSKQFPQQVGTNSNWRTLVVGYSHTVALMEDGTMWTWGENSTGQLGIGGTVRTNTPQPVAPGKAWISAAAGGTGAYNHTLAVCADGTLWSWGSDKYGQLGIGGPTTNIATTPQQVGANTHWRAVAAGGEHSMAMQSDGSLWLWGNNTNGQLGNGTDGAFNYVGIPQMLSGNHGWLAAGGGRFHSVALRDDGTLWAWGSGSSGQIGNGSRGSKVPTRVAGDMVWIAP